MSNKPLPPGEPGARIEECNLQRTTCDFAKVGEGCNISSLLPLEMAKHKKQEILNHVDLLNASNKAVHAKMDHLFSTVNTDMHEQHLAISSLTKRVSKYENSMGSLQEINGKLQERIIDLENNKQMLEKKVDKMEKQMALFSRKFEEMYSKIEGKKEEREEKKEIKFDIFSEKHWEMSKGGKVAIRKPEVSPFFLFSLQNIV